MKGISYKNYIKDSLVIYNLYNNVETISKRINDTAIESEKTLKGIRVSRYEVRKT